MVQSTMLHNRHLFHRTFVLVSTGTNAYTKRLYTLNCRKPDSSSTSPVLYEALFAPEIVLLSSFVVRIER
jgi:hypothetical protein